MAPEGIAMVARRFVLSFIENEDEKSFIIETHNIGFAETSVTTVVRAWLRVRDENDYQDMKAHMES